MNATALLAEDESLLAEHLQSELQAHWPALEVVARVGDGVAAIEAGLRLQPDIAFLDIRMPGASGLDVARTWAEDWPDTGPAFPLIVFVTAYDQYAVDAFEHAAFDYVLKPVRADRLRRTCERLQASLSQRAAGKTAPELLAVVEQLSRLGLDPARSVHAASAPARRLTILQASVGNSIHFVPVDDVLYFEAADKYVRVVTAEREFLVRTALRELQPQLDPERYWQVHRGTIVRCDAIASAERHETGKLTLTLRGHTDKLTVSRLYAHRFRGQ